MHLPFCASPMMPCVLLQCEVCKAAICFSILTFVVSVVCCLTSAWFLARTILAGMALDSVDIQTDSKRWLWQFDFRCKLSDCLIFQALGVAWQQIAFLAHDADHWGALACQLGVVMECRCTVKAAKAKFQRLPQTWEMECCLRNHNSAGFQLT